MSDGKQVTLEEVAAWYGRTKRTVEGWVSNGMPVVKRGGPKKATIVDSSAVHEWLISRAVCDALPPESTARKYEEARARKMTADAERSEMERDTMRGELVEVDVAVSMVADRLQTIRARLLNLPTKAAVKLAACRTREEVVERLDLEIQELLRELSGGAEA